MIKKVPLIVALIITFAFAGCATTNLPPSERSKTILEQADRIILLTDKDDLYREAGQYLTGLGFTIENSDSELQTIQTDMKKFSKGVWQYFVRVSVSIRDGEIHFYGNTGNMLTGEEKIQNRGQRNSSMKNAWEKLHEIATNFPHSEAYYKRG